MSRAEGLTHEIVLNVSGQAIMTLRVNAEAAKAIAKSFGAPKDSDTFTRWPLSVRRVGEAKVLSEENALANACAPKFKVQEGEIVAVITGKLKDGFASYEDLMVKKTKEALLNLVSKLPETCEWNVAVVDPGTIIEGS